MKNDSGSWVVPAIVAFVILALMVWNTLGALLGGISLGSLLSLVITVVVAIDIFADAGKVFKS